MIELLYSLDGTAGSSGGEGVTVHAQLTGREAAGQHPMDAILGLSETLNALATADAQVNSAVAQLSTQKQDVLTAGANIHINGAVISASLDWPTTNIRAVLYLDGGSLAAAPPAQASSLNFVLAGSTPALKSFGYTTPVSITVSPQSYYDVWVLLSNLQDRSYTVATKWRLGQTIIAQGQTVLRPSGQTQALVQVPMVVNLLSSPLSVSAGAMLTLDVTISKTQSGTETVTLQSGPTQNSSIVRNGGEVGANSVYGLWGGAVLSQEAINAEIRAALDLLRQNHVL